MTKVKFTKSIMTETENCPKEVMYYFEINFELVDEDKKTVEFDLKERGINVGYVETEDSTLFEVYHELTDELVDEISDYISRLLDCNILVINETKD